MSSLDALGAIGSKGADGAGKKQIEDYYASFGAQGQTIAYSSPNSIWGNGFGGSQSTQSAANL